MKHQLNRTIPWYTRNGFVLVIILTLAVIIFAAVFMADYLYLDEAYQLWNRHEIRNYQMSSSDGRLLSGLFFQKIFSSISSVEQVRYLRVFSLAGWIFTSWLLFYFAKQWAGKLELPSCIPFLLSVFCICSSAVTIYVGWALCAEVFLASLAGLVSGHILFMTMMDPGKSRGNIAWVILGGLISLLFYQTCFGLFVLPFLMVWLKEKLPGRKKIMFTALTVYFGTYLIYYILFLFYQRVLGIAPNSRTDIVFQPLKKISFFFGAPFSQAWSINLLQDLHNIFSQLLPVALLITWLLLFVRQAAGRSAKSVLTELCGIAFLLGCSYLPSLVAKENFSSYRTMIALSLCVFILFSIAIIRSISKEMNRQYFMTGLTVLFLIVAFLNYNRKFTGPLRKEFAALDQLSVMKTAGPNDTILFIRPDPKIFQRLYGVKGYKDEFGLPSTLRDWAPENLTRFLIEKKQSYATAAAVTFYQFANWEEYRNSMKVKPLKPIIIDMNEVLKK